MAYSLDLRKKVIAFRKENTLEETRDVFNIAISTISDWEALLEETGSLEKRPLSRTHKKIDPEKLAEFIINQPDAFLREIAAHFGCTIRAVEQALDKQHITLKNSNTLC
jgi:transposase